MGDLVSFRYVNYKGDVAVRRVRPIRVWFGSTSWHPVAQWLLEGFDLDKQETRDYAMSGVSDWAVLEKGK